MPGAGKPRLTPYSGHQGAYSLREYSLCFTQCQWSRARALRPRAHTAVPRIPDPARLIVLRGNVSFGSTIKPHYVHVCQRVYVGLVVHSQNSMRLMLKLPQGYGLWGTCLQSDIREHPHSTFGAAVRRGLMRSVLTAAGPAARPLRAPTPLRAHSAHPRRRHWALAGRRCGRAEV